MVLRFSSTTKENEFSASGTNGPEVSVLWAQRGSDGSAQGLCAGEETCYLRQLGRSRKAWKRLERQENLKEEKGKSKNTGGRGGVG